MRDVELRLTDSAGAALGHFEVEIEQKSHAFLFGDQVWPLDAMYRYGEGEYDTATYWKKRFADVLNAATALMYWTERPRNDASKTEDFQGDLRLDHVAETIDWALSERLTVKGHPLLWTVPKAIPEWLLRYDYETRMKFVEVRIRSIVARFRGKVSIYDVVNESLWEASLRNLSSRNWPHIEPIEEIAAYVGPAIRWAREEDPDATFLVNDYGLTQSPESGPPVTADGVEVTPAMQRRRYLELAVRLREQGNPPDALGLQSHTGGFMRMADLVAFYDEMAESGIPLHVTEFGAYPGHLNTLQPVEDVDALYADYVEKYLTCSFAHPALGAFFFWGFMNTAITWNRDRSGHELRPVYERVRQLIHREWHTNERAVSDSDGRVRFKGFFGDYALRYRIPGGAVHGVNFPVRRELSMPLFLVVPFAR